VSATNLSGPAERIQIRSPPRYFDAGAIYMVWHREIVRFVRRRMRLAAGVVRSLVWLFVLGIGLRRSFVLLDGLSYEQFLFPGIIAMAVIFASLQSAISIIWDREFGFLREVMVAPVPRASIVLGKALGGATTATFQGLIVLAFAPLAGVHLTIENVIEATLLIFLTSFSLVCLGILIAARMQDFESFGSIQNFVIMPLYLLSGAMFPLARTSHELKLLVDADPLSYGADAVRQVLVGYQVHQIVVDVLFLVAFGIAMLIPSIMLFEREG
jgi:ABC-2 type transport system permease protein